MEKVIASTALTMSCLEIADLTGKRHDHVMRDIREMLEKLYDGGVPKFGDTCRNAQNGQSYPIFRLPKRECTILVSGYDIVMRAKIVDRWMALEDSFSATVEAAISAALAETKKTIGGIVKSVVHREIGDVLPGMVEDAIGADQRVAVVQYRPALQILVDHDVPPKQRRGFSQRVSKRLMRFSIAIGMAPRESRETGRWLFHVDAVEAWLKAEGAALIRDHLAALHGQGALRLVRPARYSSR